jgi:hypothetical protein
MDYVAGKLGIAIRSTASSRRAARAVGHGNGRKRAGFDTAAAKNYTPSRKSTAPGSSSRMVVRVPSLLRPDSPIWTIDLRKP